MLSDAIEHSLRNYPFLYTIFLSLGSGFGLAWGLKSLIDKFVNYYLQIKDNQNNLLSSLEDHDSDIKKTLIDNKTVILHKLDDIKKILEGGN